MAILNRFFEAEAANWVVDKIDVLEGRAKFCAYNALRYLKWANETYAVSSLVSNFNGLHATEEAVACFISSGVRFGSNANASKIKLREHKTKALVSIFAQRCLRSIDGHRVKFGVSPNHDNLIFDLPIVEGGWRGEFHLSQLRLMDEGAEACSDWQKLGEGPDLDDIFEEISKASKARNALLYADDDGVPTGFTDPEEALIRDTKLTFGLIWAAVDLHMDPARDSDFLNRFLAQIVDLQKEGKARKKLGSDG
ncbi:hypothetical protein PhaeoP83_00197 [Phaeobacter inhibens]|uniref:Uncharacterized protein n=1 Tax=Phaeobacter inhibens TaxID=221822 RepID=A0A2I7LU03_9RHOB|nr:hypothetical protein [Phaeobacter inhibens]AUQ48518.1 hypothetical protein PhaeoP83_00197 [Phaeobacter inhibens]AUQ93018.1 hypothetical protein PhaeoP66_00190 [Phaeobacter inhibens]AUR00508.1 hypothetical protein PhaeoP88_03177 [Phaeobacter inhibens]AUR18321.1 hypothetical protein PhaeoP80_00197 [Phaeobacter inhibens]